MLLEKKSFKMFHFIYFNIELFFSPSDFPNTQDVWYHFLLHLLFWIQDAQQKATEEEDGKEMSTSVWISINYSFHLWSSSILDWKWFQKLKKKEEEWQKRNVLHIFKFTNKIKEIRIKSIRFNSAAYTYEYRIKIHHFHFRCLSDLKWEKKGGNNNK